MKLLFLDLFFKVVSFELFNVYNEQNPIQKITA